MDSRGRLSLRVCGGIALCADFTVSPLFIIHHSSFIIHYSSALSPASRELSQGESLGRTAGKMPRCPHRVYHTIRLPPRETSASGASFARQNVAGGTRSVTDEASNDIRKRHLNGQSWTPVPTGLRVAAVTSPYRHPERRVVACVVCKKPIFPDATSKYSASGIFPRQSLFRRISKRPKNPCRRIRINGKMLDPMRRSFDSTFGSAQDDTLIIFVQRRTSANAI